MSHPRSTNASKGHHYRFSVSQTANPAAEWGQPAPYNWCRSISRLYLISTVDTTHAAQFDPAAAYPPNFALQQQAPVNYGHIHQSYPMQGNHTPSLYPSTRYHNPEPALPPHMQEALPHLPQRTPAAYAPTGYPTPALPSSAIIFLDRNPVPFSAPGGNNPSTLSSNVPFEHPQYHLGQLDPPGTYAGPQYYWNNVDLGYGHPLPGSTTTYQPQMSGWNPIASSQIGGGNSTSTPDDSQLGNSQAGHGYPAPDHSNQSSGGDPASTPYDLPLGNPQADHMHPLLSFVGPGSGIPRVHSAVERPCFDAEPHDGHGQVPASEGGSSHSTAAPSDERKCTECGTRSTSAWRRHPPRSGPSGALVCN
ncbi:hypothetical protein FB45DRAFT_1067567, partial [Roridomyces roridus]